MSDLKIFGQIRDGQDVEQAVQAHLKKWLMTYVAAVERYKQDTPGSHPAPRTWSVQNAFQRFPEETLPMILIIATGTRGGQPPKMEGDGNYRVGFGLGVVSVASGQDWANSRHNAMVYASALRAILLQRSSCGTDWIGGIEWQGEEYEPIPAEQGRSLAAVMQAFIVIATNVVNGRMGSGAPEPPDDPVPAPDDPSTVQSIDITLEGVS